MKTLILIAASLPLIAASSKDAVACRNIPGDAGWPTEADWKAELPGSTLRGEQKRLLHPDYRLEAKSVDDVIAAVKFAAKHNVRLTAITSGHDGLGRNDAPTGLLVGMEKLTGMRVEQTFTPTAEGMPKVKADALLASPMSGMARRKRHGPDGDMPAAAAPPNNAAVPPATIAPKPASGKLPTAVTFGAGVNTQDMNNKLASQGIFTNGAEHGEVGVAGGWSQCGGHGPMTSAYGLGSDDVLEYQVVTADGQLKIANEVANPDLFWALRGGCGSTFGLVTQATVKAYPSPKFTVTKFDINATSPDALFEPIAYLHSALPDLSEKGVQGYYLMFPGKFTGIFHTVGDLATQDSAKKLWEPVLSKVATYPGISKESTVATYIDYPDYKTYYDATWGPAEEPHMKRSSTWDNEMIHDWWTGEYIRRSKRKTLRKRHSPGEADSLPRAQAKELGDGRLLDKVTLQSPKFAAALRAAMPAKGMMRGVIVGGAIVQKSTTETSIHPSWRKAYASIWSDKDVDEIAALAKGMGAYINEASWNTTNWQDVFWGTNYPKLSQIKTKYDPNMVFYVTPGINAEQMMANEKGALCKAPEAVMKNAMIYPPVGDNKNIKKPK